MRMPFEMEFLLSLFYPVPLLSASCPCLHLVAFRLLLMLLMLPARADQILRGQIGK